MYRVLLVDDHKCVRDACKDLPVWGGRFGFQISGEAENGLEALALLHEHPFDLVLTDIQMPAMSGMALLKTVRKEKLCPCVALMSESAPFSDVRGGFLLGAFDYLVKPISEKKIGSMLKRAAGRLEIRPVFPPGSEGSVAGHIRVAEHRLLNELGAGSSHAAACAETLLCGLLELNGQDLYCTEADGNQFLLAAACDIWKRYPWFANYYRKETLSGIVSLSDDFSAYLSMWKKIIECIAEALHLLLPARDDPLLSRICIYMLEHPEQDIRLHTLSRIFYLNRTYLSGAFHQKSGVTFREYLLRVRMMRARFLFDTASLPLSEICARLGYCDLNYFSHQFRRISPVLPSLL